MKASDNVFPKVLFGEAAAPATPATGEVVMYAKTDGKLYSKDDAGTETALGGGGSDNLTIITEASATTMVPATHSGRSKLILVGGDVTFNSTESYAAGNVFNIRATGAVTLVGTGVTLTAPAGGTLSLSANMTVTVAMTSSTAGAVIGQTVAA